MNFRRDQTAPSPALLRRQTHHLSLALSLIYACKCGWRGLNPDSTDTSEAHADGGSVHLSVCPECGEAVQPS